MVALQGSFIAGWMGRPCWLYSFIPPGINKPTEAIHQNAQSDSLAPWHTQILYCGVAFLGKVEKYVHYNPQAWTTVADTLQIIYILYVIIDKGS